MCVCVNVCMCVYMYVCMCIFFFMYGDLVILIGLGCWLYIKNLYVKLLWKNLYSFCFLLYFFGIFLFIIFLSKNCKIV